MRRENIYFFIAVIGYLLAGILLFAIVAKPSLMGESPLRIGADSLTYIELANRFDVFTSLIVVDGNYLGPVLLLRILDFNHSLILALNYSLFLLALYIVLKNYRFSHALFLILLLLNPMLLPSLLTINKEILGMFTVTLFAWYLNGRRHPLALIAIVAVSLLVRWEQALAIITFSFLVSRFNPFREHRKVTLAILIGVITIAYPVFYSGFVLEYGKSSQELIAASTRDPLLSLLNDLQNHFLFPLALVPKMLSNLFGPIPGIQFFRHSLSWFDFNDIFGTFVVPGHQLSILVVSLLLFIRGALRPRNWTENTYFIVFYVIFFSVIPVIQARYIFPVYMLLCLEAARAGQHHKDSGTAANNAALTSPVPRIPVEDYR
jgi:hypothetical protein